MRSTPVLTKLVVLSVIWGESAVAAQHSVHTEVRVGRGNNSNQFTVLYFAENEQLDSPFPAYSTLSDYGSFYNNAPGEGANTSLWSGRAAAQAGAGYLRVFSQVKALTAGPNNRFTSSNMMAVNGSLSGLVESDGTERVTPGYITGGRATITGTISTDPDDEALIGEVGSMRVSINVSGTASYSQGFFLKEFGGHVISEAGLRIAVGPYSELQKFDLERESYWDYDTKPFSDDALMGGPVVLDAPITFGESYDLEIMLWSWAQISGHGSVNVGGDGFALPQTMSTVIANYHNTATWDGVALFDMDGEAVTGVVTVDGEDFTGPFTAPEPPELPPLVAFADFDGDGDVDGDDFLIWQAGFNVDDRGDANGDGVTDGDDFLIWQSQFGSGSGSASAAAPEPTSIALTLLMAAAAMLSRRTRSG